jgi:hypothetical protein
MTGVLPSPIALKTQGATRLQRCGVAMTPNQHNKSHVPCIVPAQLYPYKTHIESLRRGNIGGRNVVSQLIGADYWQRNDVNAPNRCIPNFKLDSCSIVETNGLCQKSSYDRIDEKRGMEQSESNTYCVNFRTLWGIRMGPLVTRMCKSSDTTLATTIQTKAIHDIHI